jgi:hypothetical protein
MKKEVLLMGIVLVGIIAVSGCTNNDNTNSNVTYMSAEDAKNNASAVSGTDLQRNAMNMVGKPVKISGKVFDIHTTNLLMYMGDNINQIVYVKTNGVVPSNIIKDDTLTVYGVCEGKTEYETAAGGSNTVPLLEAWPENIIIS